MLTAVRSALARFLAVALCVAVAPTASAQVPTIDFTASPQSVWAGPQPGSAAGAALTDGQIGGWGAVDDFVATAPGWSSNTGCAYLMLAGPAMTPSHSLNEAQASICGLSAGDRFGTAVDIGQITATSGVEDLIVGAPGALSGRGVVYLFSGGFASGLHETASAATLRVIGAPGDSLGAALANADVNGDGYADIVIGAPGSGRVYVIAGAASLSGTIDLSSATPLVTIAGAGIGSIVAAANVMGTSAADLLVGAPTAGNGAVYVIAGRTSWPSSIPVPADADAQFTGSQPGDQAGAAVAGVDLDGDGRADVVVGAPNATALGRAGSGAVYVVWGASTMPSASLSSAPVTIAGPAAGAHLGSLLAHGNVNRDTPSDVGLFSSGVNAPAGQVDLLYGNYRYTFPAVVDLATNSNRRGLGDRNGGPIASLFLFDAPGGIGDGIAVGAPSAPAAGGAGAVYLAASPTVTPSVYSLSMSVAQGGTATATMEVSNSGLPMQGWAAHSNSSWLTLDQTAGTVASGSPVTVMLTASGGGLVTGSYHGSFSIVPVGIDLDAVTTIDVTLTVSPGTAGVCANCPFGPPPADQGSMLGVTTPVGSNIAVAIARDIQVSFPSVTAGGQTSVIALKSWPLTNRSEMRYGPFVFQISTTATAAGPATVKIAYGSTFTKWERGVRLLAGSVDVTTAVDPIAHVVTGSVSSLPAVVAVVEDAETLDSADSATVAFHAGMWSGSPYEVLPLHRPGIAAADYFLYRNATGAWYVVYNNGQGGFGYSSGSWSGGPWTLYAADLNGDGLTDIFLYNPANGVWSEAMNTGNGSFAYFSGAWSGGPYDLRFGDFNGDGLVDVLLVKTATGAWSEATNTGAGQFRYTSGTWLGGPWDVQIADFNGDHRADLLLFNQTNGAWYEAMSDGAGQFNYTAGVWSGGPYDVKLGDFNGDGRTDAFIYNRSTGRWFQALTTVPGAFAYTSGSWLGSWWVTVGRFNQTGRDSLVIDNASGLFFLCLTDGQGGFTYRTGSWPKAMELIVSDINGDGTDDVLEYSPRTGQWFEAITR